MIFDLGKKPVVMGIVNVTPDLFSDGGRFLSPAAAIDHALCLLEEGANWLDLGAESSRPGANAIDAVCGLERLLPVLKALRQATTLPISIDTTKASVARACLEEGANLINDISAGSFDPQMFDVVAKARAGICLMHMRGTPRTMQTHLHYDDLVGEVKAYLQKALQAALEAGIDKEKIWLDVGIGFGKSAEDNVRLLQNLSEFSSLGAPILIGTSRKSFLGKLLGYEVSERLEGSLASLALAYDGGARIFRVHDVAASRRFLDSYALMKK